MTEEESCRCFTKNNQIMCEIPITLPTSKVRIKRIKRSEGKEEIEPVAPRKQPLNPNDYIEWQISYFDSEDKKNLIEFGYLLEAFYKSGEIRSNEICDIVEKLKAIKTFEESFVIRRQVEEISLISDFKLLYEKTPILRLDFNDKTFIDIVLRHKQRAVGYQAMVYIYIPINSPNIIASRRLINRVAEPKETVTWIPRREHILGLLKAFLIASQKHRNDIIEIITKKMEICR
mgnify:CR=1 FL=1